jgi:hypothetical protein
MAGRQGFDGIGERVTATSTRRGSWRWPALVGLVCLALAAAALGYELLAAAQSGRYRMIAAGELWFKIDGPSLNLVQAIVQRYLHPALWDPGAITVLQWPAWSILGAIGAVLTILSGPWLRRKD